MSSSYPNPPYQGFSWQISQHAGVVSSDIVIGLLNACKHLDGLQIDIDDIDARIKSEGILPSENDRSLWRDYQQILCEFGLMVARTAGDGGIVRLTQIGKALADGELSFAEMQMLQLLRYQYPNGYKKAVPAGLPANLSHPLSEMSTLTEIQSATNVRIRPCVFLWRLLDSLWTKNGKSVPLSPDEVQTYVFRCFSDDSFEDCLSALIKHREGKGDLPSLGATAKRNASDWIKLLVATDLFSFDKPTGGIRLSGLSKLHAVDLRWLFQEIDNQFPPWELKNGNTSDWFSYFGTIPDNLRLIINDPAHDFRWLFPGLAARPSSSKDRLANALAFFEKHRANEKADVWPSFDDWVKDARQTFAAIDEHQIVAPTFDYNHFVKFVFSSRQRTTFSKFDASQKAIVGKFLREERTSPHSASWYLDPANKVPVEGIGVGIMFYFMMMVRPDEFATWSGMMDEGLFIIGLRSDPKSDEPTVANYEKTKALQQIILQKMHEMGIGKAADDPAPADYLTVNEFLWFVTANEKDIKEEIMKQQLKKPTGNKAAGKKKLSDVLSSKADDLMNRLVAALLTKPFAILAGASGTGKSRMAKKLAYMTCLDKDLQPSVDANGKRKPLENFIIVPVKPNWHDSSDLLGYRSSIKEKGYQTTPFINFIIKAHCFPNTPFIACLDEMNLAPVEHYFAEYLSASEGSIEDAESGKSVSYPLIEPALFDADVTNLQLDGYALPAETKELIERVGLVIPKNLFVVGTVNMDDSTDQISRKVLDRAMTIEMNDVNYSNLQNGNYEKLDTSSLLLEEDDIAKFSKREAYDPSKLDNDFRAMLDNIKGVFEGTPFALGYRFGIESTLYREALKKLPLKDETGAAVEYNKIAVDHMTLMKVLPRITGTVDERSELLSRLKAYFKDNLDDKGLSKTALARMEKAAKSNGGYLGFWP